MEFGLVVVLGAALVGYLWGKQKARNAAHQRVMTNPHIPQDVKELLKGML